MDSRIKYVVIALFLSVLPLAGLRAQTAPRVQMFEGGVFVGISGPLGGYRNGSGQVGPMLGLDFRFNIVNTPYDVGLQMNFETVDREYYLPEFGGEYTQRNRVLFFGITGDYNFRQGRKINPFAGVGVGMAVIDNIWSRVYPLPSTVKPSFLIQGGVELFHHVRVTAHMQFCRKGYNSVGLTLGLTLGGRPKK